MVFFNNYFRPNQQMPITSGFRDDLFYQQLSLVDTDQFYLSSQYSELFKSVDLNYTLINTL